MPGVRSSSVKILLSLRTEKGISTLDSSMTTAVGGSSELYKGSQALVSGLQRVDQGQVLCKAVLRLSVTVHSSYMMHQLC